MKPTKKPKRRCPACRQSYNEHGVGGNCIQPHRPTR